jgi:carbon monoxide dehydrogenase subunit G
MKKLTFKIKRDVSTIMDHLTNAEKFVSVHPLIYKMKRLGENKYKVYEKIDVGNIPYRFTYKAFITQNKDSVQIDASVMGITNISVHFTFLEEGDFTLITEKLVVKSILPVKHFLHKLFEKQHQIMFNTIEKV